MEDIGPIFKAARLKKKVTASQAAAATRMKVQHVEALERGDFSRMAAPMYAKGFIKIYAEYLGLDPMPLIKSYMDNLAPKESVVQVPPSVIASKTHEEEPVSPPWWKRVPRIKWPTIKWPRIKPGKPVIYGGVAVVVILVVVVSIATRDRTSAPPPTASPPTSVKTLAPAPVDSAFVEEPPEPFIDSADRQTSPP